jgi:hypothetical protein
MAAWNKPVHVTNPFLRLHTKLQRTGKALHRWAKGLIGNNKVMLCAAEKLIGILDVMEELKRCFLQRRYPCQGT